MLLAYGLISAECPRDVVYVDNNAAAKNRPSSRYIERCCVMDNYLLSSTKSLRSDYDRTNTVTQCEECRACHERTPALLRKLITRFCQRPKNSRSALELVPWEPADGVRWAG